MFTCGRALYSELTTETKSVLLDCSAKAESVELNAKTKISTADSVLVFESARSSVQQSAHKSTKCDISLKIREIIAIFKSVRAN